MSLMSRGTIKWFNEAKGFGFILPDGGGKDIFVHYSGIVMKGFKTLAEGERVEYEMETGPDGKLQASNVRKEGPTGNEKGRP